jgi:hypothetical protein
MVGLALLQVLEGAKAMQSGSHPSSLLSSYHFGEMKHDIDLVNSTQKNSLVQKS